MQKRPRAFLLLASPPGAPPIYIPIKTPRFVRRWARRVSLLRRGIVKSRIVCTLQIEMTAASFADQDGCGDRFAHIAVRWDKILSLPCRVLSGHVSVSCRFRVVLSRAVPCRALLSRGFPRLRHRKMRVVPTSSEIDCFRTSLKLPLLSSSF